MSNNPFETPASSFEQTVAKSGNPSDVADKLIELLRQTKPWARFISILLQLSGGLMAAFSLMMAFYGITSAAYELILGSAMYFAIACIYFFPGYWLWIFANKIVVYSFDKSNESLIGVVEAQKHFWKLLGISTVISIVSYVGFILYMSIRAMAHFNDAFSGPI